MNKKNFLLVGIWLLLMACTLPVFNTPSPENVDTVTTPTVIPVTEPTEINGLPVTFNNITFIVPPDLNINVSPVVSTNTEYPFIYPSEEPMPEHVRFEFSNYPIISDPENSNEILVFKASEYASFNPSLQETVNALLAKQDSASPLPESLVGNNFFAQAMPIHFKNGHGVRYLDQVLTGIAPINNQELFYYFQGITDDGAYFISARLHVSVPFLVTDSAPNSITPTDGIPFIWDPTNFDPAKYYQDIEERLNSSSPDAFTPSINLLDELINSILVTN